MIKIISFDLDGTLVKSTYADDVWLKGVPRLFSMEKNIPLKEAESYIYLEYEKVGEHRKEWYDIDWWFKQFKLDGSWRNLLDDFRGSIQIFPESTNVIENLVGKFDLIIISNAKKEFVDIQLEETGLKSFFSHVFSSLSDFNELKKYPNVYQKICKIVDVKPSEMIHIGDNKQFDFESPKKIGIKSFYLNRNKSEEGSFILHNLSEILDKISN